MNEYDKIIEALEVDFIEGEHFGVIYPVKLDNQQGLENVIYLLHKGSLVFGDKRNRTELKPGELLFVPASKGSIIAMGAAAEAKKPVKQDHFNSHQEEYLEPMQEDVEYETSFTRITISAKVFESVDFFSALDISTFSISKGEDIIKVIDSLLHESYLELPGRKRMLGQYADQLIISLVRYMLAERIFVEKLATNSTYFRDPRLIHVFNYIRENIDADLSNKVLAKIANVSEDYVGQYFKMLTGINPQDYIEYQRMEKAVDLLRYSRKSIRNIGNEIGYKDTAYFCRRFKMMFGIPAGKMRKRERLLHPLEEDTEKEVKPKGKRGRKRRTAYELMERQR
ncbi:MAG: helix-turn-helix transcriptional regulator [Bernardetiaceae bacterium]|nr:helix-turn-helix transcriptional regulator [Bernardetiaceae bacterium]